jgi:hypothetical protein
MAKSIDNFFAQLYCKEMGIAYDKGDAWAEYADSGNYSYVKIGWRKNGECHNEQIKPIDAFNLIAKYALTKDVKDEKTK